jgi:replicative DNA helicase
VGELLMKPGIHPVIRAEQALLGSVLVDPDGQGWLLDLVDASDLIRPYHGQVLGAMKRVRGRGAIPGAVAVREEIRTDPDLPRSVSGDGVLLADLMDASPRPEHGPAYAAMVISTGIRCRMALAASRMRQAAGDGDAETALRMARQASAEAERCRARWNALPEPMRREVPSLPGRYGRGEIAGWLNAASDEIRLLGRDMEGGARGRLAGRPAPVSERIAANTEASAGWRQQQAHGRPSGPEAEAAGARALRDLIAAPSRVVMVREWLQPGDFARADHGELYAVVIAMAEAGRPVDPVTVSWEAARCDIVVDAADLADGDRPFAVTSAREVRRHGVLAQVARVANEIEASTGNPASSAAALLEHAAERLGRLDGGAVLDRARPGGLSRDHPVAEACPRVPDRDAAREAAS